MHGPRDNATESLTPGPGGPDLRDAIELDPVVTDAQRTAFVEDGFLVSPDLLLPESIAELIDDTYRIVTGGYPDPALETFAPGAEAEQALERILCIHMPQSPDNDAT